MASELQAAPKAGISVGMPVYQQGSSKWTIEALSLLYVWGFSHPLPKDISAPKP